MYLINNIDYIVRTASCIDCVIDAKIPVYRFTQWDSSQTYLLVKDIKQYSEYAQILIPSWTETIINILQETNLSTCSLRSRFALAMQVVNKHFLDSNGFLTKDARVLILQYYNQEENYNERDNIINEYLLKQV